MDKPGLDLNPYSFLPLWLVLVLAGVLLALAVCSYRRTTRPVSGATRLLMLLLRAVAILVVCLMLLRPGLRITQHFPDKRPLLVLVDRSRSMSELSDVMEGQATRWEAAREIMQEAAPALEKLRESFDVRIHHFGRELIDPDNENPGDLVNRSAYGHALREALRDLEKGLEAVVLVGDGSNNAGRLEPMAAAGMLADRRVPLHTVGVGQDSAGSLLRDVGVGEVSAPKSTFRFTRVPVRSAVTFLGCAGRRVRVRLEVPELEDFVPEERVVAVTYTEEVIPVAFEVSLKDVGEFELRVTAETIEGELLENNNTAKSWIKVKDAGVLLGYADTVRPESKFVARALHGTENLSLDRHLVVPGAPVPADMQQKLTDYDVTVIGDIGKPAFDEAALIELVLAVQEDGHGLVVLLSSRSGGPAGLQYSPLAQILPVSIPAPLQANAGPKRLQVANPDHPAVSLSEEPGETLESWSNAPPLAGIMTGAEVKTGAHVIARTEDGHPAVVVQRSGKGLVAAVLADTTFKWTFTHEETQWLHRRFWRQIVFWAAGKEPEVEMSVEVDKRLVNVHDEVKVRVIVNDRHGKPMRDAAVEAALSTPDEESVELPVSYSLRDEAFVGTYTPSAAGDYRVDASAGEGEDVIGEDSSHFSARAVDPELADPLADLDLLRSMSKTTDEFGGRFHSYRTGANIFNELQEQAEPVMRVESERRPLWDFWQMFAVMFGCLVTEWAIRKRKGLI